MEIEFPWVSLALSAMTPREQLTGKKGQLLADKARVKANGCL